MTREKLNQQEVYALAEWEGLEYLISEMGPEDFEDPHIAEIVGVMVPLFEELRRYVYAE